MAGRARPFKVPSALYAVLQLPVFACGVLVFIEVGVRLYSGASLVFDEDLGSFFLFVAASALPGAVTGLLRFAGRIETVDALPDPGEREEAAPALLSITTPGAGGLRPAALPRPTGILPRRRDGVLFVAGLVCLGLAAVMMVFQTDSFDALGGIKLGGVWFRGAYWNRWWFVFYGFAAAGVAALVSSMAMFIRRSNREGE